MEAEPVSRGIIVVVLCLFQEVLPELPERKRTGTAS